MWGRRLGGVLAVIVALAAAVAVLAGRDLSPDVPDAPLVPTRGATRLVSLAPEITEILFALDAGDDLVGRSALCQTPEEALELPAMGTAAAPDLEALRKAGPTRIVVTPVGDETKDQLEGIAPVTVLRLGTPDRLVGAVHVLGRLTGHVAEAVDLATRLTDALTPTVTEASPRVVVALGVDDIAKGEVWYLDPQTLHGRALLAAGLQHAADPTTVGRPVMSVEELVERDPDLILVWTSETRPLAPERLAELVGAFAEVEGLRAARAGHVGVVAGPETFAQGPGIAAFVDAMRAEADSLMAR